MKPRNPQQHSITATSRNSTSRTAGCHLYKPHPRRHSQTRSRRRVKSKAAHTLSIQGHRPPTSSCSTTQVMTPAQNRQKAAYNPGIV
ncbi:MAG: hypothetical protein IKJ58_11155 [Akkermansia sp.]|nr:hypothetical protein [Akkermansia sp.]